MKNLAAIRKQVEYYFSDANFPRDKFLRQKCEEDEKGFVDISVLLTFNRLSKLGATVESIAEALADSDVVILDDGRTRVKRRHSLPEASEWRTRTMYVKGWTAGGEEPEIESIEELFAPSGDVSSVRMRRWVDDDGRHFKGSIFVEFATAEMAERAAAEEYSVTISVDGKKQEKTLITMMVDDYFAKKRREARAYRERKKAERAKKNADDPDGNVETKEEESPANGETKQKPKDEAQPAEDTKVKRELVRKLVVQFEGVGSDMERSDIKEAFKAHGDVAYVAYNKGDTNGFVRFTVEGEAESAISKMSSEKTELGGKVPQLRLLEGEEEEKWWNDAWDSMDKARARKREREGNGGGDGRGGKRFKGGFRGRGRSRGRGRGRSRK